MWSGGADDTGLCGGATAGFLVAYSNQECVSFVGEAVIKSEGGSVVGGVGGVGFYSGICSISEAHSTSTSSGFLISEGESGE